MIEATAPGKLVLSGEYAVLDGAPAIVAAIGRRARIRLSPGRGEFHEVRAPGFTDAVGRFVLEDGIPSWIDGADDYALVDAVLAAGQAVFARPMAINIDTSSFYHGPDKLGLGSSAALAAALAVAISDQTELAPAVVAANGHRRFQGGGGSGADVAAAIAGGVIDYRMQESGWTCLDWPADLQYQLYFAGHSTSTGRQLQKFASLPLSAERAALSALADEVAMVFREPSLASLLGVCKRYTMALQAFDAASDLGIFSGGHAELVRHADDVGLVYKPCGAGGGDVGIALSHDSDLLKVFERGARAQGFTPLDAQIDPGGARLTECLQ